MRGGRLGDYVDFLYGKSLPARRRRAGSVPVFGSAGRVGSHDQALVKGPGVIVGRKGTIGAVHWSDDDFYPIDTTYYVVPKNEDELRRRYLYYLLNTLPLRNMNTDAAVPGLNRSNALSLHVTIAPPPIQDSIIGVLSAYDRLIDNNRRRIRLLERAARLLYREWFIKLRFPGHEQIEVEDGMPVRWERRRIDDVCRTVGGGTPSTTRPEYWKTGDVTWIVPTDVTRNDCLALIDSERKITEQGLLESSATMVPAETILMTSRASVGYFALMDREVCTNQGFINIVPRDAAMTTYLLFNLMSRVEEIRSRALGTTYPEISKGRFRTMEVVIPEKRIVTKFAGFAADVIRQVRILKRSQLQLAQARDLILPRLLSGRIAV